MDKSTTMLLPLSRIGSPRKHRLNHRTALLALLALISFTCYLLFIAYPSIDLSQSLLTHVQDRERPYLHEDAQDASAERPAVPHRKVQHQLWPVPPPRHPLALTSAEELAALSAFIAALPHNVLPATVDPDASLDPQLVLDFDPRSDSAREELDQLVDQVWSRFPVMLYAKLHSSDSREVRHMLSNMHLVPAPLVVEVDQRQDADVLAPLLTRLARVPTLPILLIGGQPVGTDASDPTQVMDEIRTLHENGELARRTLEAGATVEPQRRKAKGNNNRRRAD